MVKKKVNKWWANAPFVIGFITFTMALPFIIAKFVGANWTLLLIMWCGLWGSYFYFDINN